MPKGRKRKAFTVVELLVVIPMLAILAIVSVVGYTAFIKKSHDSNAITEAQNVYTLYMGEHLFNEKTLEFMIYDANGRFVALHNGAPIGIYSNTDDALASLVNDSNEYVMVQSLKNKMYLAFKIDDMDVSAFSNTYYNGKTIACIGDSVTVGVGVSDRSKRYASLLAGLLGATENNLGASGTVLCTGGHRGCNISGLTDTTLNGADIVTIMMGVNDWDNSVKDGCFKGKLTYDASKTYYHLGELGTDDTTTVYGALKMWCDKIEELKQTEQYKNTQFFFITPHLTSWNNSVGSSKDWNPDKKNVHGYTQKEMRNAIIDVCNMYDIPVIDVYDYTVKLYNQDPTKYIKEYGGDGIHPTAACHQLITDYILMHLYIEADN